VIVRVLGVGQFRLGDEDMAAVNAADDRVEVAFGAGDEPAMQEALADLAATIRRLGDPLPVDEFTGSDVVVPGPDTTLDEATALLTDEGAIPG
jgi:hypothetical protein